MFLFKQLKFVKFRYQNLTKPLKNTDICTIYISNFMKISLVVIQKQINKRFVYKLFTEIELFKKTFNLY